MMFLTPGSNCTPRWTACGTIFEVTETLTFATPFDAACRLDQTLPQGVVLRLRRVAELDVESDVAARDAHVAQLLRRHQVATRLGVDDALQGLRAAQVRERAWARRKRKRRFGANQSSAAAPVARLTIARCRRTSPPPHRSPSRPWARASAPEHGLDGRGGIAGARRSATKASCRAESLRYATRLAAAVLIAFAASALLRPAGRLLGGDEAHSSSFGRAPARRSTPAGTASAARSSAPCSGCSPWRPAMPCRSAASTR